MLVVIVKLHVTISRCGVIQEHQSLGGPRLQPLHTCSAHPFGDGDEGVINDVRILHMLLVALSVYGIFGYFVDQREMTVVKDESDSRSFITTINNRKSINKIFQSYYAMRVAMTTHTVRQYSVREHELLILCCLSQKWLDRRAQFFNHLGNALSISLVTSAGGIRIRKQVTLPHSLTSLALVRFQTIETQI